MSTVVSTIAPGPQTVATAGDVPLSITWGNHFESLERGGYLEATGSDGVALTADSDGRIYVRAGSVLVKTANEWRLLNTNTDTTPADSATDEIADATAVGILKQTVDLANGGGLVGIYIQGGFIAARMPSIADNAVAGLEAAARAALSARGFRFSEDFH